jgi:hypothetical protein
MKIPIIYAQSEGNKKLSDNLFIETKVHYGFLLLHHKKMRHLQTSHFSAYEINSGFQTYGKNAWDTLYSYPKIGLVFWYSDIGRSPYLGSAYALYPYMSFPLVQRGVFSLNFRLGFGMGYLSKPFDQHNNYKNIAIGSRINGVISFLFSTYWKINQQWSLTGGLGLTHFSNGAYKTPNLGINIPTVNIGVLYYLSKSQPERIKNSPLKGNNKYEFNTFLAFGLKEMYPPLHRKYFTASYSALFYKLNRQKNKYGLGLDFFYNTGNLDVLYLPEDDLYSNLSVIRIGISFAYELMYNRLSFLFQSGPYFKSRYKTDGNIYSRIGLRYNVSDHWFINLTLKAHFGKADHVEFGLGYKL